MKNKKGLIILGLAGAGYLYTEYKRFSIVRKQKETINFMIDKYNYFIDSVNSCDKVIREVRRKANSHDKNIKKINGYLDGSNNRYDFNYFYKQIQENKLNIEKLTKVKKNEGGGTKKVNVKVTKVKSGKTNESL